MNNKTELSGDNGRLRVVMPNGKKWLSELKSK
jgi:hypothetical protein